jgi:hypothetical protein
MKRFVVAVATVAMLVVPLTATADDHLANAANSQGVEARGFRIPVAHNPSGQSGAAAMPGTGPGLGNPNFGTDQGTPSFNPDTLACRLHLKAGHEVPGGIVCS